MFNRISIISLIPDEELWHMQRVSSFVNILGHLMSREPKYRELMEVVGHFAKAAFYHDIGKAFISESVLLKEGKLTECEYAQIKEHPLNAVKILKEISFCRSACVNSLIFDAAVYHHERWDGRGYPYDLAGESIPLIARVTSVCDAFDAMTFQRAYNIVRTNEDAFLEIERHSGSQFDPGICELMLDHKKLFETTHKNFLANEFQNKERKGGTCNLETYQNESLQENEDTQRDRYLLFAIDKEVYGIEIRFVTEIIGMQPLSTLPETPEYIKGVINLRGKIIPVIDMRLRFKKQAEDYTDRTCIVVIEAQSFSAGLIVDEVAEVLAIEEKDIAPPPKFELGVSSRYVSGIGKVKGEVKLLLSCEKLFSDEETQQIESIKGGFEK